MSREECVLNNNTLSCGSIIIVAQSQMRPPQPLLPLRAARHDAGAFVSFSTLFLPFCDERSAKHAHYLAARRPQTPGVAARVIYVLVNASPSLSLQRS